MGILGIIAEIIIVIAIVNHFRKKRANKQVEINHQPSAGSQQTTVQDNVMNEAAPYDITGPKPSVNECANNTIHNHNKEIRAYSFPLLTISDKGMSKSRRNVKGTFYFEDNEYVAIAYDNNTEKLFLFQKAIIKNNTKTYTLVDYGYLWMKLYKCFSQKNLVLPYEYDNLKEMPEIADDKLNILWENEKSLREAFGDIERIELSYSDGTVSILWKIATLRYEGKMYHFMALHTDADETEIHQIVSESSGEISYEKVDDTAKELLLWEALAKEHGAIENETKDYSVQEITEDTTDNIFYINNNSASLSNMVGALKVYDSNNNVVAKVSHNPLLDRYTMRNGLGEFMFKMDGDVKHKFHICLDEDSNEAVMEFAKRGNFTVGFGLGHFVALPLASLPFGSFYGVSRRGNIYLQKNGKSKDVYLDNVVIARITHKTGFVAYAANSKSSVEMFTNDAELQAYVFAIFVCMHALN